MYSLTPRCTVPKYRAGGCVRAAARVGGLGGRGGVGAVLGRHRRQGGVKAVLQLTDGTGARPVQGEGDKHTQTISQTSSVLLTSGENYTIKRAKRNDSRGNATAGDTGKKIRHQTAVFLHHTLPRPEIQDFPHVYTNRVGTSKFGRFWFFKNRQSKLSGSRLQRAKYKF
jgi:hypothetical protein